MDVVREQQLSLRSLLAWAVKTPSPPKHQDQFGNLLTHPMNDSNLHSTASASTSVIYLCYDQIKHPCSVSNNQASPSGVRVSSDKPISKIVRAYIRSLNLDQSRQSVGLSEKEIQKQSQDFELLRCHCTEDKELNDKDDQLLNPIPEDHTLIYANLKDGDKLWIRRKEGQDRSSDSGRTDVGAVSNGNDSNKGKGKEKAKDETVPTITEEETLPRQKGKQKEEEPFIGVSRGSSSSLHETKSARQIKAPKRKPSEVTKMVKSTAVGRTPQATRNLREKEVSALWGNELWKEEAPVLGISRIATGDNARLQGVKSLAIMTNVETLKEKNLLTPKEWKDLDEGGLKGYPQIVKDQLTKAIEERREREKDLPIKNLTFGDIRNARDRLTQILDDGVSTKKPLGRPRSSVGEAGKKKDGPRKIDAEDSDATATNSTPASASTTKDAAPGTVKKRIKITSGKIPNPTVKEGFSQSSSGSSTLTSESKDENNDNGKREMVDQEGQSLADASISMIE